MPYGTNPFDKHLSDEAKQKLEELKKGRSFDQVQEEAARACRESFEGTHMHDKEWAEHQERAHTERLEQAQVAVPVEVQEKLQLDQDEEDRLDDERFGWITAWDQLLQLPTHEDYLRARRSFERRIEREAAGGEPILAPWTLSRIGLTLSFLAVVWVGGYVAVATNPILGLVCFCILLPIWAVITKVPGMFGALGDGGMKGSGNAI